MDIIISAHFCPTLLGRFARVYPSDNILSVWGLEEEGEEEEGKKGAYFLIYIYRMPVGKLELLYGSLHG